MAWYVGCTYTERDEERDERGTKPCNTVDGVDHSQLIITHKACAGTPPVQNVRSENALPLPTFVYIHTYAM